VKRLKGPELKLGKPQVPLFLVNLYYDLRDRRLLPLVALVIVAILAVPFLLGGGSGEAPEPAATGPIGSAQETGGASTLTVVEAQPGLRDYRKRLRDRTPTDPFKKPSTGASAASSAAATQTTSTSTTSVSVTAESTSPTTTTGTGTPPSSTVTSPPAGNPAPPAGKGGSAPQESSPGSGGTAGNGSKDATPPDATLYSFGIDVTIVHSSGNEAAGDKRTSEPDVRKRVLPTTSLPGKDTQVVTYLGLSPKTRKPLFLVSTDVTGVFGEGKCAAGSDRCQLIELEPGMPEVFEYGEKGDRYKITATHVQYVVTGHS
jgi:hypothetical protein